MNKKILIDFDFLFHCNKQYSNGKGRASFISYLNVSDEFEYFGTFVIDDIIERVGQSPSPRGFLQETIYIRKNFNRLFMNGYDYYLYSNERNAVLFQPLIDCLTNRLKMKGFISNVKPYYHIKEIYLNDPYKHIYIVPKKKFDLFSNVIISDNCDDAVSKLIDILMGSSQVFTREDF